MAQIRQQTNKSILPEERGFSHPKGLGEEPGLQGSPKYQQGGGQLDFRENFSHSYKGQNLMVIVRRGAATYWWCSYQTQNCNAVQLWFLFKKIVSQNSSLCNSISELD